MKRSTLIVDRRGLAVAVEVYLDRRGLA